MSRTPNKALVYSAAEAQRLLGLSRSTLYARLRDGSLPSVRIGGRILVPRRALERLLDGDALAERETAPVSK